MIPFNIDLLTLLGAEGSEKEKFIFQLATLYILNDRWFKLDKN